MGWQDRRLVEADERRLLPSRLASGRRRYSRAAALQHITFLVMFQPGVFHFNEGQLLTNGFCLSAIGDHCSRSELLSEHMLNTSSIRGGSSSTGYWRGRHRRATALASLAFKYMPNATAVSHVAYPRKDNARLPR